MIYVKRGSCEHRFEPIACEYDIKNNMQLIAYKCWRCRKIAIQKIPKEDLTDEQKELVKHIGFNVGSGFA